MADFRVALLASSCGVHIVRLGVLSSRALKSAHSERPESEQLLRRLNEGER